MSKSKSIQITIPNPCSQKWDAMIPDAKGRRCDHCQKSVIDFTTWSDTALYNFFSKNTEHVCGRFLSTQVNHPINIPYQPHSSLYRIAIALGLTLIFTERNEAIAQNKAPLTQQNPTKGNTDTVEKKHSITAIDSAIIALQNDYFITGDIFVREPEIPNPKAMPISDSIINYLLKHTNNQPIKPVINTQQKADSRLKK